MTLFAIIGFYTKAFYGRQQVSCDNHEVPKSARYSLGFLGGFLGC
jgi:lactam utilization protein B